MVKIQVQLKHLYFTFIHSHYRKLIAVVLVVFWLTEYANLQACKKQINRIIWPGLAWSSNSVREQFRLLQDKMTPVTFPSSVKNLSFLAGLKEQAFLESGAFLTSESTASQDITPPLHLCPRVPPNLVGRQNILTNAPSFEELEYMFPSLLPGGRYMPGNCIARHKVAIITPFRDREEHLRIFLHNLHLILQRQQLNYGIYIVEEIKGPKFNRAMLMNIGYVEALKQYNYTCFIFHDVDLIPEDDRNLYSCPDQPRHMSVAINTMNYILPYADIFGGVSALTQEHMKLVNGFSNEFWGWGGEDDDMANRIKYNNLTIVRYSPNIARYTMLKHPKAVPSRDRHRKLYKGKYRYKTDGLINLKYKRIDLVFEKLFTWILVKIESRT